MIYEEEDWEMHDSEQHIGIFPHTRQWYANWGNKCPVCGITPVFEMIEQAPPEEPEPVVELPKPAERKPKRGSAPTNSRKSLQARKTNGKRRSQS